MLSIKGLDGKLVKGMDIREEIQITGILKPGETYLLAEVLPASRLCLGGGDPIYSRRGWRHPQG
ncbi:MAG: hypothetical protein ACLUD2_20700 [Clostridium sp.]